MRDEHRVQIVAEQLHLAAAVLQRWADAGAVWRVVHRGRDGVTVALYQCDGGEEVDRISSTDPRLLEFLAGRASSED